MSTLRRPRPDASIRYQRVAFLECDLGQSEFTPGGMVALNVVSSPLFGPSSFTTFPVRYG